MSIETEDQRPTNLADALDDAAFILDAFDGMIQLLHKAGVQGFEVDGEVLELPIDIVGDEAQRDFREAARRTRALAQTHAGGVVINSIWPKEQQ